MPRILDIGNSLYQESLLPQQSLELPHAQIRWTDILVFPLLFNLYNPYATIAAKPAIPMGTNGASLAFWISLDPWSSSYEERETSVSLDKVIEESSDNYKMFQVPTSFWLHSRIRPPRIFFLINYFNWRLITLKYCGCFCHTLTWIRHGCTCVPESQSPLPPPSQSHPSGLSQCTGSECPVSCIELGLVI